MIVSIGVIPVLAAVLTRVAAATTTTTTATTPPPVHEATPSSPPNGHLGLSILLQTLGFSDTCVAAALDTCSASPQESQLGILVKEARDLLQDVAQTFNKTEKPPRHCKDLLDSGDGEDGVRVIHPYPGQPDRRVNVYCDQTTDGGGWSVFQRRTDSTVREDFYRTWIEYKMGFGNITGEFWLGLDPLHALASTSLQELRVDLEDWEAGHRVAKYGYFHVDGPGTKYLLQVGRYSGDAGDSLLPHSGSKFTTHDSDNDSSSSNCAQQYRGAWWYKACHSSNLNGYQHVGVHTSNADGINWANWRGYRYSLRHTTMMVRPAY